MGYRWESIILHSKRTIATEPVKTRWLNQKFIVDWIFKHWMADKSRSKEEIDSTANNCLLPNEKIKAASSNWLVEDLTPATMIMVDDSPPPGNKDFCNLKKKQTAQTQI